MFLRVPFTETAYLQQLNAFESCLLQMYCYPKGFALCRRPPILGSPAFWLAHFLLPKPAICEPWWAHFGILEHHLGDLGVPGDTQEHTWGSRCRFLLIFCHFGVSLGTHLELILLTFLAFGHPFCLLVSEVCFLVFWEWKSCQDPMLECA